MRWVARGWGCLLLLLALAIVLAPAGSEGEGNAPSPSVAGMASLVFYGLSVLGLLLAWRWELAGGVIAILGVMGHEVAFIMDIGRWMAGNFIVGLAFILPALLFILCWALTRRRPAGESAA